jgi:hypothetical protein
LPKRFLPAGTQHRHVVQLAEEWFIPLMRDFSKMQLSSGVAQIFKGHRPLQMQARSMDNRKDALDVYIAKQTKTPAEQSTPLPANNAPIHVNEFDYYLFASTKDVLWSMIEAKRASGWADNSCKKSYPKKQYVAALASAFGCVNVHGGGGVPPTAALVAFKHFCSTADPPLIPTEPKKAWSAGLRQVVKPPKRSVQQALASAPSEAVSIQKFGTLAWDPKDSPFGKP